jgi:hypothetical protein
MKMSKLSMFLCLNGIIAFFLVIYFGIWLTGEKTTAKVVAPYAASKVTGVYAVDGIIYKKSYLRNDIAMRDTAFQITYFKNRPSSSRIYSFMGIAAEPLAWWFIFLLASSMLLLTDNLVFSKGTVFRIQKKFPWISMEEYFRLPWYANRSKGSGSSHSKTKKPDEKLIGL